MRKAFTLLELLAVIAIITLLIGILLPAVQGVREAARRTQCINRQRNLAVGLLSYENTKGSLPGWRDFITMQQDNYQIAAQVSWVFCVLPFIEQANLYDQLKAGQVSTQIPPIYLLHCPSLPEGHQTRGTHYVVNGGAVDDYSYTDPVYTIDANIANGPFLDRASLFAYNLDFDRYPNLEPSNSLDPNRLRYQSPFFDAKNRHAVVRESDISKMDGTAYTLMTSENCQRGYWISQQHSHFYHKTDGTAIDMEVPADFSQLPDGRYTARLVIGGDNLTAGQDNIEGSVAFCWPRVYPSGQLFTPPGSEMPLITYPLSSELANNPSNLYQGFTGAQEAANPPPDPVTGPFVSISRAPYSNSQIPVYVNLFNRKTFSTWYQSARPSSMHVGVIIASFCDGNVTKISSNIFERTFVQLMTVSDALSDAGRALPVGAGEKNFLEGQLFDPGKL